MNKALSWVFMASFTSILAFPVQAQPERTALRSRVSKSQLNVQLVRAVEGARVEKIRGILKAGANPNTLIPGEDRSPVLLRAIAKGLPRIVKALLEAGANPDLSDARGTPILVSAASLWSNTHERSKEINECIRILLLEGKADPDAQDSAELGDDRGPLHLAAVTGNFELTKLLLKSGANPNLKNRFGETALHFASERGHGQIAQLLVHYGASVKVSSRYTKMTPLMSAAENGQAQLVKLLVVAGSSLRSRNAFGKMPLTLAKMAMKRAEGRTPARAHSPSHAKKYLETIRYLESALLN